MKRLFVLLAVLCISTGKVAPNDRDPSEQPRVNLNAVECSGCKLTGDTGGLAKPVTQLGIVYDKGPRQIQLIGTVKNPDLGSRAGGSRRGKSYINEKDGNALRKGFAVASLSESVGGGLVQPKDKGLVRVTHGKPGDFIDVRDFGARCDGSTNDTKAISDAIGALGATGGEVLFPSGHCIISPIVVREKTSIRLRGEGRFATTLVLASPGTAMTFSNSQWVTITQMTFTAIGQPQSLANAYGIQFDAGSGNGHIDEVSFVGFSKGGLRLIGNSGAPLSGFKVTNCYFLGNGGIQLYSYNSNDFHYQSNQFGELRGVRHADVGAYLVQSSAGIYTMNLHWSNGVALRADDSSYNTYSLNRFEMSDRQNVYVSGGSYVIFASNKVHTGSLNGNGQYDNVYLTNVHVATIDENLVFSWNETYSRWGMNVDVGCSDITLNNNKISGFGSSWGPIRIDGSLGNLAATDFQVQSVTTAVVMKNATTYLGANGASAVEAQATFIISRKAAVVRFYVATDAAPGAGQSFTYTLRKNGTDTAMSANLTGAASFATAAQNTSPEILVKPDDVLTIKLTTSETANRASHRYYIELSGY